ncbi:hypothetical protein F5972_08615 [Microbispora cellulosiformans]|uniref:Uncharacterized protein n=1 Tax=Microbispora cellulosiformans TaxID=2614688 RepID=A0A5J5K8F7_9ACTN|nr:hypothetical protein [Microbispora cellulosiformans]KAA9379703.1 hypothetical protein F5972_08615 [Microbispora cellulosiformans]
MTVPCPFPACSCTHVGCVAGWVDSNGDKAVPCPNCRPEVYDELRRGRGTLADRRRRIRNIPRPSRTSSGKTH